MLKPHEYNIYKVTFPHPSFHWANGFYALINTIDNEAHICKINKDTFKPDTFDNGKLMLSITSINNLVEKTDLLLITNLKH